MQVGIHKTPVLNAHKFHTHVMMQVFILFFTSSSAIIYP